MEEQTVKATEVKALDKETIRPYLDRIIHVAHELDQASATHSAESQKFELAASDFLMKGAGMALFVFPLFLAYNRVHFIPWEPVVYFGIALILGVTHKVLWSRKLAKISALQTRKRSQIMSDLYDRVLVSNDGLTNVAGLWRDVLDEENALFDLLQQGTLGRRKASQFKYVAPYSHVFPWQIFIQLLLVLLGALSALNLFSFWEFITHMPFALSAGFTGAIRLDSIPSLFH